MQDQRNSFERKENEIIHKRVLHAPRTLVWDVWTDPKHIKEWFGPDGFSLTTDMMNVKAGGLWTFTMHGAGQDFPNRVEYTEVREPEYLAYKQGGHEDTKFNFSVEITFEETEEGNTLLTMRSIFQSAEVVDELDRMVNAIEGGKQNMKRLEAYVEQLNHQRK